MADARRGLNCTLSYNRRGAIQTMKVRVDLISHGIEMVADESTGRNTRAYYPHRVTPSRFALRVLLVGYTERRAFANWMLGYADYVMDPGLPGGASFPDMRVVVPARRFDREGVPLGGIERGDAVGAMTWAPVVTFETTREPQDTEKWATSTFVQADDPDMKYFWPSGTQLGGDAVPSGSFTTVVDGSDGGSDSGQSRIPLPHTSSNSTGWARDDYGD